MLCSLPLHCHSGLSYRSVILVLIEVQSSLLNSRSAVFEDKHGLNPGLAGCAFLSIFIGCALSVPVSVYFNRQYLSNIRENNGVAMPESVLFGRS